MKSIDTIVTVSRVGTQITDEERQLIRAHIDGLNKFLNDPEAITKAVGTGRDWGWDENCEIICAQADLAGFSNILQTGVVQEW